MHDWVIAVIGVAVIFLMAGYVVMGRRHQNKADRHNQKDQRHTDSGVPLNSRPQDKNSLKKKAASLSEKNKTYSCLPREQHCVSRRVISPNALKVLHRLNSHGYEAYLVGGCIRDLLLSLTPKDFDVTTSATPEEVHQLFRNSRVIGRRFKLVHVLYGREIIEVATFRANSNGLSEESRCAKRSASGRILRDNVYGSLEDDAFRRDFTVNALYYSAEKLSVIDYCGGVRDMESKLLRLIGDADERYREDPVRMLRAIRFSVKLHFSMAPETAMPIRDMAELLKDIPAARLFDEVLKLLQSGRGEQTFELLKEYGLFEPLFPLTCRALSGDDEGQFERFVRCALKNTDERINQEQSVTSAFLFAALLWRPLQQQAAVLMQKDIPEIPAIQQAATLVLSRQSRHTALPRRISYTIREIWELQVRLVRRQPRTVRMLPDHPRFRAAYDFLLLREKAGEELSGAGHWWAKLQVLNEQGHNDPIQVLGHYKASGEKRSNSRRRRPHRKQGNVHHSSGAK
ncbi:Poly(A) polymerase I [invertebrate metagenome]|uniref:Poly(A) polymerase I n=1 Tax=invertebrate metagenome TaxID=1711999 RepID=A0A2H9TAG7_9ZZZZ